MKEIVYTNEFKKSVRKCVKQGRDITLLQHVVDMLADNQTLPARYKAHKLTGNYAGLWECHIQPDWLLIWASDEESVRLILVNTGSHASLFG